MESCGECHGPIQCTGDAKPVTLFPCCHLLHYHCSEYVRKNSKLSNTKYCCPVCGCQIFDVVSLFVSEVIEGAEQPDDGGDDDNVDVPLDVNAMLTRVFHFQKRNLMHQRQILESKIELRAVQTSLASVHQRKTDLERRYGACSHILQSTERVQKVKPNDLLGLVVSTTEEVDQLTRNIDRLKALNQARRRNVTESESALRKEMALSTSGKSLQATSSSSSKPHAPKRSRSPKRRSDVVDVDVSSDDEDIFPFKAKRAPDVQIVTKSAKDNEDEGLPPLFPVRPPITMPQMGVSFNRSVRDIPRSTDTLVQSTLRKNIWYLCSEAMESEALGINIYKCEWKIPNYQTIVAKSKPKQKLTSPQSEALPVNDVPISCKMIFFPKGTGRDDDTRPTVAVMFSSGGDQEVRLSYKCLVRSISGSNEIMDDSVESGSGYCGTQDNFGDPSLGTFSIPEAAESLILSVTFQPFSEERELMDNVRSGLFSFHTAVTSLITSPQQALQTKGSALETVPPTQDSQVTHPVSHEFSADDQRYLNVLTKVPEGQFWEGGKWSVLVHVCISFSFAARQLGDISTPSDEAKQVLFEKCPPMRTRALEASHDVEQARNFWVGLLTTVEGYSMINSIKTLRGHLSEEEEADDLLNVLLFAVDPASISFFVPSEVETIVALLREAAELLLESPYPDSDGTLFLEKAIAATEATRKAALAKQNALRESIRVLISYHTWNAEAEECLARQLLAPSQDPLAKVSENAIKLQRCFS